MKRFFLYTFLGLLGLVFLFPILVTLSNAFMSPFEIAGRYSAVVTPANLHAAKGGIHFVEMSLIPAFVSAGQFVKLFFSSPDYLGMFWNSVKITLPVVAGQLLISIPAAYAFAFSRWKYKEALFFIYIVVMMMPLQVSLVPNYIMANKMGIQESVWGVILPGVFNPFGVFLIRQYLNSMPEEYIEAAKMDGAGYPTILAFIVLPMIRSAVAALFILTFIEYWNVVEQAVIYLKSGADEPMSVMLSKISGSDIIFAASCFYMLPALLIFLYGQENMIEGIQLSGIK